MIYYDPTPISVDHTLPYLIGANILATLLFGSKEWFFPRKFEDFKQEVAKRLKLADMRGAGFDALLVRAKDAVNGADTLAGINMKHGPPSVVQTTINSLQKISAFLEPISPEIKFNYLHEDDLAFYKRLCDALALLVLFADPVRASEEKQEYLEQISQYQGALNAGYENFRAYTLNILRT